MSSKPTRAQVADKLLKLEAAQDAVMLDDQQRLLKQNRVLTANHIGHLMGADMSTEGEDDTGGIIVADDINITQSAPQSSGPGVSGTTLAATTAQAASKWLPIALASAIPLAGVSGAAVGRLLAPEPPKAAAAVDVDTDTQNTIRFED